MRACLYRIWHWWCALSGLDRVRIILETVGFFVVVAYTSISAWQTHLLRASVRQQAMINRPVLLPHPIRPNAGGADATVMNFGKTVALEVVVPGEVVSAAADEAPPFDPRCRKDEPPKDIYMTSLAPDAPYTAAEAWELAPGDNFNKRPLYAVGCVYYKGLDGVAHYTDICMEWKGDNFQACKDRDRNYVK
jgi:hypothetical protein